MEGINSVFFVTKDRFTKEEADAWDVMWQVLFGAEVLEFSSIIRTNLLQFRDSVAVAKDKRNDRKTTNTREEFWLTLINETMDRINKTEFCEGATATRKVSKFC